ncbi:unnamed protein product [Kluyveromyces dobzhanskii CBS 2104]|uniref:WGS project CCBQ000000000 data, contig 00014 n=1 Tax=Kluyveromyces dobzhanskii CBS 2104 TaxID=1427455 RepID=A0A0A8L6Y8_9SACH|nr:unnamed protein product [Kluyveromyces dobzhanskii CBS 2104]
MFPITRTVHRSPIAAQCFRRAFSSTNVARTSPKPKDPDQRMFDRNQKKLEHLEEEGHGHAKDAELKRPSLKTLQKKGKEAPIKQQRPDDGVY